MQRQHELIDTYFSEHQIDYWSAFFGRRCAKATVSDVSAWSAWFAELLGSQPAPLQLESTHAEVKTQLFAACRRATPDGLAALNAPLTIE
jgi:hypothetical protein